MRLLLLCLLSQDWACQEGFSADQKVKIVDANGIIVILFVSASCEQDCAAYLGSLLRCTRSLNLALDAHIA